MKLKDIINIGYTVSRHTAKIQKLAEEDVDDLSISELAFIKMVSGGSITAMKKAGATNERILLTEKKEALSADEKVKRYLQSLTPDHLAALLDKVGR